MARRQARLILGLVLLAPLAAAEVKAKVDAPATYIAGSGMPVRVELTADAQGDSIPAWMFGTAAFSVDGKPLAERGSAEVKLAPNQKIVIELDLGPALEGTKAASEKSFKLAYGNEKATEVACKTAAKKGLDFLNMPVEELKGYQVLLRTNRGPMLVDLWPDVAPNHVRNFLDLSYTGFYDGTQFHRVSPTFMIQGGDPNTKSGNPATWGTGNGPRTLKREFSSKTHARGVLSMARGPSEDSASSQFFIITAPSPFLDGKYSAFGELVEGFPALDTIAKAQGQAGPDGTVKPSQPQKIEAAVVLVKGGK
ncbi:MAG: peptidylprolyl isomerase [Planctomycetota bacterium]|nr:peptidylprolyl isomerase [Planctomycetota bacterium]